MNDRLLTYLKYGNQFCGIEHATIHGQEIIYATQIKQSKRELLVKAFYKESSVEAITKSLSKQSVFLVLNNDKVLTKTIESDQQETLKLVYKAFPNINLDEFYYEVLSQNTVHFIALCRKDYVDDIINKYSEFKLSVIDVSLGNTITGSISSFLNEDYIFSSNAKIDLENKQIKKIEKTDILSQSYDINGLSIPNDQLLSFSGALQTLLRNNPTKTNISDKKLALQDDFKQTRFFSLFLKIGGLLILGLLLINFFFFNHYFNKVGELKQLSVVNQSTKNQILNLDGTVSTKQKMIDDLLKSNGSKSSFYSNSIVHSLPKSILLSKFNYQPLLKRIKPDKPIELNESVIDITGRSSDSDAFSSWISALEREDWVSKVVTVDYGSTSSSMSDFKVKIILSDD